MKYALDPRTTEITLWVIICTALSAFIFYETDWGQNLKPKLPEISYEPNKFSPPALALIPPIGSAEQHFEMVEKPLFVFTRRPAPPGATVTAPTMKKGQYKLAGVTIVGEKKIAFLIEIASGKMRTVQEGKDIGEINVADIQANHVRLTQGNDEELVALKVEQPKSGQGNQAPPAQTPRDNPQPAAAPPSTQITPPPPPSPVATAQQQPAAPGSAVAAQPKEIKPGQAQPDKGGMDFDSVMRRVAANRAAAEKPPAEQKK